VEILAAEQQFNAATKHESPVCTPAIREFKGETMRKPSPIRWSAQVRAWTGTLWVVVEFVAKLIKLWRDFR